MTRKRKSRREIERALDELTTPDCETYDCEELTVEEKETLAEAFDVDPWGDNSPEIVGELHRRYQGGQ